MSRVTRQGKALAKRIRREARNEKSPGSFSAYALRAQADSERFPARRAR